MVETKAGQAAEFIRKPAKLQPRLGIVLGSGFGKVREAVAAPVRIPYRDIPGFPTPTVEGHCGELLIGRVAGLPVAVLCGRAHFYEGYSMEEVTFPMRALHALGIKTVLLTNAAGGINPKFSPGTLMMLTDHINLMGANPLRGVMSENRFADLTEVYDGALRKLLRKAGGTVGLKSGVYVAVSGPSYETPAEIRAFAKLGADAVGMSTVPEAVMARFLGMRVAAVACITNMACGLTGKCLSHEDVLQAGIKHGRLARELIENFCALYGKEG